MQQNKLNYLEATAPTARWSAKYPIPSNALLINTITVNDNVISYDSYQDDIYCDATSSDIVVADYTYSTE